MHEPLEIRSIASSWAVDENPGATRRIILAFFLLFSCGASCSSLDATTGGLLHVIITPLPPSVSLNKPPTARSRDASSVIPAMAPQGWIIAAHSVLDQHTAWRIMQILFLGMACCLRHTGTRLTCSRSYVGPPPFLHSCIFPRPNKMHSQLSET